MKGLRVLTMNVLSPAHADWERRREILRTGLAEARPDVVALQEVVERDAYEILGPDYQVVPHSGRSADGVGAVLASRWPIGPVREVDLHVTARVDLPWSAAVVARIEAPFGPLLFVHHKPTYHIGYALERELQAVKCAQFVEREIAGQDDIHVVLAGDFDDTPDSSSVRYWTGLQSLRDTSVAYRDAWSTARPGEPGHTFSPENPLVKAGKMALERGRRIDYVMVRCGTHGPTLDVTACELAFTKPTDGVWPSDHFGVIADLALPHHPPATQTP